MQGAAVRMYPPGYDGRPIALTHLRTEGSEPPLASCNGEPFRNPGDSTPSILCPACMGALGRE